MGSWPQDVRKALECCGILRETSRAEEIVCPGCEEGCIETIEYLDEPPGSPSRAYIICSRRDDIGRVEIHPDELRRWTIDVDTLASFTGDLLGIDEDPEELKERRLWSLGSFHAARGQPVAAYLFRGIGSGDAAGLLAADGTLREAARTLLFILDDYRPVDIPTGIFPLSLSRVLTITEGKLGIDSGEILEAVKAKVGAAEQHLVPVSTPAGLIWDNLRVTFITGEEVLISFKGNSIPCDYRRLGFADRRRNCDHPSPLWSFLHILARKGGQWSWGDKSTTDEENRLKVKKWISEIRKKLKSCFPDIQDDPFHRYSSREGYRTRFILTSNVPVDTLPQDSPDDDILEIFNQMARYRGEPHEDENE